MNQSQNYAFVANGFNFENLLQEMSKYLMESLNASSPKD